MPCSVLLCRRPQLEYFQSVGDFAPSFAHASRTSQVQVYVFAGAICIFISFTMPAIPAESAKMQKLHLCTFAYSFCANHAILFTHASHTSRKRRNAFLHIRLAPTTPPFLCPCQPYQPKVQKCKCTFAYSACASHHILALPRPAVLEKVEKCKVCVLACSSIFAVLHCQLCQLSQLKVQKCKHTKMQNCSFALLHIRLGPARRVVSAMTAQNGKVQTCMSSHEIVPKMHADKCEIILLHVHVYVRFAILHCQPYQPKVQKCTFA